MNADSDVTHRTLVQLATLFTLLSAALTFGIAWGVASSVVREQGEMLQRIDSRVTEMYCDGKPPGCR